MPYHEAKARCEWQDSLLATGLKLSCAAVVCAAAAAFALRGGDLSSRLGVRS